MRAAFTTVGVFCAFLFAALPAAAISELKLVPGPLLSDVGEDPKDDAQRVAQKAQKGKGKGQGQGSRVSIGARTVTASGVSPMGKPLGIGLQIGAPTSVTLKYMLTPDQGIVAGLGAFGGWFFELTLSLHVDYLWHPHVLVRSPPFKLSWYVGGGLWLVSGAKLHPVVGLPVYYRPSYVALGGRLPIGVDLAMNELPLEFYLEATPSLLVFPALSFGLGLSAGVRFYF